MQHTLYILELILQLAIAGLKILSFSRLSLKVPLLLFNDLKSLVVILLKDLKILLSLFQVLQSPVELLIRLSERRKLLIMFCLLAT